MGQDLAHHFATTLNSRVPAVSNLHSARDVIGWPTILIHFYNGSGQRVCWTVEISVVKAITNGFCTTLCVQRGKSPIMGRFSVGSQKWLKGFFTYRPEASSTGGQNFADSNASHSDGCVRDMAYSFPYCNVFGHYSGRLFPGPGSTHYSLHEFLVVLPATQDSIVNPTTTSTHHRTQLSWLQSSLPGLNDTWMMMAATKGRSGRPLRQQFQCPGREAICRLPWCSTQGSTLKKERNIAISLWWWQRGFRGLHQEGRQLEEDSG